MNLITKIAQNMKELVTSSMAETLTLTDIEQTTREIMQLDGQETIKLLVQQLDPSYPESEIECDCGAQASYIRRRPATLHTLMGKIKIERAYYLCPSCHQGTYPLDQKLGLRPNQLSAELSRLAAMTGVELPFAAGRDLFEALTLVSISDQAMSKATTTIGSRIEQFEKEATRASIDEALLLEKQREEKPPLRMYGSIDATKVHIRDDEEHRWRDLKIGAFYEARGKPPATPNGKWTIQAEHINYFADICHVSQFSPLLWAHGVRHNAQLARELIFVCDGADWIWNIVEEHFPNAIQILDWFHASEHLAPVAQAIFIDPNQASDWIERMKSFMWDGDISSILDELDTQRLTTSDDIIRITANYFERNKQRMRYAEFRKQGYQIGSGTIESAAKQIGMMRLKVPGAIWNEDSARKVAKARAEFLSNRWSDLPLAT